jgi:hypothetical protein
MSQYKEDLANVSLYANDIKRLALMMSMDKSLFILVTQEIEDNSVVFCDADSLVIDNVVEEAVPGQAFGMSPRHPLVETVSDITALLRKVFKKKDTESLTKVYTTLMKYPKEDLVMGLIESLSKQSPEKQRNILEHVVGAPQKWKNKVAIEVVKRSIDQRKNRDSYDYYVCFKNLRNGDKRFVTFNNHASAAIYVMHLVDRVIRKDNCTPIDVTKNIDSLKSIYNKLFSADDKIKGLKIDKIIDSHGDFVNEKLRLRQYYSDINKVVNENLYDWDFVMPYRCESDSFVLLNPDWITIDNEIIPQEWNMVL